MMKTNIPLLAITNLSTLFKQGDSVISAVKNVSLEIASGETFALVGESGSGKSVLAHSILKLLPYPKASHPNGSIVFNGDELLTLDSAKLRTIRGRDISMIFQEPMTALNPLQTIETQILECIPSDQKNNKIAADKKVLELLRRVKIDNPESRLQSYPHQLSGGQRQRVMIAMAIANNPKLLIADEPTTALDVTVQSEILHLLQTLQAESQMAILLITHDLNVVKHYADQVAVMKSGEIVETGTTDNVFNATKHEYTKLLLKTQIQEKNSVPLNSEVLLQGKNITVNFRKGASSFFHKQEYFSAVKDASFSLNKGESLGIVGESGCGKSTLANAILKLVQSEGTIILGNSNISQMTEKQFRPLRKNIQIVFQDPFASLSPRMNILNIVGEGLKNISQLSDISLKIEVINVLTKVGLNADILYRYPHEFSGGQRQRIAIARAIIMKPDCLVLDEPTSALDRSVQFQVLDLLLQLQRDLSLTYLFISHDLRLVKEFCHNVLVMKNGAIVESGNTDTVFNAPKNPYTQQLIEATL